MSRTRLATICLQAVWHRDFCSILSTWGRYSRWKGCTELAAQVYNHYFLHALELATTEAPLQHAHTPLLCSGAAHGFIVQHEARELHISQSLQAHLALTAALDWNIQETSWEWFKMRAHLQQPAAGAVEGMTCHKSGRQTTRQKTTAPKCLEGSFQLTACQAQKLIHLHTVLCMHAPLPPHPAMKGLLSCRG